MGQQRIGIIGGGLAGAACGARLRDAGLEVVVFDKGRGPGGRASTRRSDLGSFDHGAQYFTARSETFRAAVQDWQRAGAADVWEGVFGVFADGQWRAAEPKPRWVGTPGMNAIVRAASDGLDIRYGARADRIAPDGRGWRVEAGEHGADRFDALVVAVPAPQAADLLDGVSKTLADVSRRARMDPCWTVMAVYPARLPVRFDGGQAEDDGPLGWVARDSSKPGRTRDGVERWVIQATPAWSRDHLERTPEEAGSLLLRAFAALVGPEGGRPTGWAAHRWRYAFAAEPVGADCLWDPRTCGTGGGALAVAGDWLVAPRIESAYLSGRAAAERILLATA